MTDLNRRGFLTGLTVLVAAPAIVRASSLMPVKAMPIGKVYGISPAAALLEDVRLLTVYRKEFMANYEQAAFDLIAYGHATIRLTPPSL